MLTAEDVFDKSRMSELAKLVDARLQEQVNEEIAAWEEEAPEIHDLLGVVNFSEQHLGQFYFRGKEVVFYYEFGLPHAMLALEPDRRIVFTEEELKGCLKVDL